MLAQLKALSEDVGKLTPDVASLNKNLLSKRRQARIEQDLDATEECPKGRSSCIALIISIASWNPCSVFAGTVEGSW
jgi:hypothetical protein